jgi:transcriptional regulator with XRE-family HTH domain
MRTARTEAQVAAFRAGLRLIDLERLTGISMTRVGEYLRGDRRPSRAEADRLARALGADASSLFPIRDTAASAGQGPP